MTSGSSECRAKIKITRTDSSFVLSGEFGVIAEFTSVNQGVKCYREDAAGRIFRPKVCEKTKYKESRGAETLFYSMCDNDLGIRCKPGDHTITLETQDAGKVRMSLYNRYPSESKTVCDY